MIHVDFNVLLDLITNDRVFEAASLAAIESAGAQDQLVINDVVYSEISVGFARIEELETVLGEVGLSVERIPKEALFLAGKVFRRYRSLGGTRTGVLPDFFIGAHASITGSALLTRDAQRYRTYFPTVRLIEPR